MTDEVRQEDREAAYELADDFDGRSVGEFLASIAPQAFARHASPLRTRIAELEGALEDLIGGCVGLPVPGGDGETFVVYPPATSTLKRARAALQAAGGKQDGR